MVGRTLADASPAPPRRGRTPSRTARSASSPSSVRVSVRDHERRPVRACRGARPASPASGRLSSPAIERSVHDDVLLVVDDPFGRASSEATVRDAGPIASQTGTSAKTGPPTTSSVASAYAPERLVRRPRTRCVVARPYRSLRGRSSDVIPVVWPPFTREHLALDEVRPRRAEEEDRAGGLLGRAPAAERDRSAMRAAFCGMPSGSRCRRARTSRRPRRTSAVSRVSTNPKRDRVARSP